MERFSQPHHIGHWCYVVRHEDRAIEVVVTRIDERRRRVIEGGIHHRVPANEADDPLGPCDRVQGTCRYEGCILTLMYAYDRLVPPHDGGLNETWLVPEAFWQFLERVLVDPKELLTSSGLFATLSNVH